MITKIEGNLLEWIDGQGGSHVLTLQRQINKAVEVSGTIVLLFNTDQQGRPYDNLAAIDESGRLLWQKELDPGANVHWAHLELIDRKVYATTWHGVRCEIEPSSGQYISTEVTK